jgi:hypothetical protein
MLSDPKAQKPSELFHVESPTDQADPHRAILGLRASALLAERRGERLLHVHATTTWALAITRFII